MVGELAAALHIPEHRARLSGAGLEASNRPKGRAVQLYNRPSDSVRIEAPVY